MAPDSTSPSRLELACEPPATGYAVEHAREVLHRWQVPRDVTGDAVLIVDELITNAVRHAGSAGGPSDPEREGARARGCALELSVGEGGLLIRVQDESTRLPALRRVSLDAECGRGLQLVAGLSEGNWGTALLETGAGKSVWARLPLADVVRHDPAPAPANLIPHALRHPDPVEQPKPWSTPGTWTITTTAGFATSGYLPEWAEDDPTEVGVPHDLLPSRLAAVNHRNFFEGAMMPLTGTDSRDDAEEDAVFEGSIDCNPYDPDPRLRVPVVNLQLCVGRRILGLDPDELASVAQALRAQADRLRDEVLPALIAAREDWAARQPD